MARDGPRGTRTCYVCCSSEPADRRVQCGSTILFVIRECRYVSMRKKVVHMYQDGRCAVISVTYLLDKDFFDGVRMCFSTVSCKQVLCEVTGTECLVHGLASRTPVVKGVARRSTAAGVQRRKTVGRWSGERLCPGTLEDLGSVYS
ncbi:hypothetical protein NDU88_005230 [Pleurodeles waltl]|uniref:Uncharacterized protein n=1 Tax=Pleurodeles waltl TaxID=8319 RepID=A0AAV7ME05_PLEWA|nr:hypothetical protein NDU88_005230 [Pleurodeles waltl]